MGKAHRAKSREQLQKEVNAFNEKFKPGDEVALKLDSGKTAIVRVLFEANIMGGSAVTWFEGLSGYYLTSRVSEIQK
jgi:ribosomal protein L21E